MAETRSQDKQQRSRFHAPGTISSCRLLSRVLHVAVRNWARADAGSPRRIGFGVISAKDSIQGVTSPSRFA